MAYHIDNKNLPKCNAAPQTPSLELEMLKNRYENAIKKAEEAKQLFEQKALGLDNNQTLAATNAQLVEQVLPTLRGGLQTKEVAPADIEQVVTPDDGYLGLQRVKVAPYEREVQVVNRRANESEYLYYMEDIATQYQRSDYAVCMAGEFYKNADTTILAGADAYLTSDGDFYTAQTTHTWHDDDDMHANRWVVYYFKQGENKSNFMIADASACPTVLAVKGHLGAIIANIAVSIRDIIIPDGSSVLDIRIDTTSWNSVVRINNLRGVHNSTYLIKGNNVSFAEIRGLTINATSGTQYIAVNCANLKALLLPDLETYGGTCIYGCSLSVLYLPKLRRISGSRNGNYYDTFVASRSYIKTLYLPSLTYAEGGPAFSPESMRELIAPKLASLDGMLFKKYGDSPNVTKVVLGSFVRGFGFTGGNTMFTNLIHLEFGADGGAGLSASLNLYCWTCSAIDLTADDLVENKDKFTTNKEQLLYNFKTYTIERLQNRTNMSRLTLTIGTYLYNIVTQETDDSLTNGVPYGEWLTAKLAEINWSLASA